jgi:hypothetical protein
MLTNGKALAVFKVSGKWEATATLADPDCLSVSYLSPCCNNRWTINVQPPTKGKPVETELWCHRDGKGDKVTIGVS